MIIGLFPDRSAFVMSRLVYPYKGRSEDGGSALSEQMFGIDFTKTLCGEYYIVQDRRKQGVGDEEEAHWFLVMRKAFFSRCSVMVQCMFSKEGMSWVRKEVRKGIMVKLFRLILR